MKRQNDVKYVTTESQKKIIELRDNCARMRFFSRKTIRKTHAAPLIAEIYMPNEANNGLSLREDRR